MKRHNVKMGHGVNQLSFCKFSKIIQLYRSPPVDFPSAAVGFGLPYTMSIFSCELVGLLFELPSLLP